jgi:hypothetical protein
MRCPRTGHLGRSFLLTTFHSLFLHFLHHHNLDRNNYSSSFL